MSKIDALRAIASTIEAAGITAYVYEPSVYKAMPNEPTLPFALVSEVPTTQQNMVQEFRVKGFLHSWPAFVIVYTHAGESPFPSDDNVDAMDSGRGVYRTVTEALIANYRLDGTVERIRQDTTAANNFTQGVEGWFQFNQRPYWGVGIGFICQQRVEIQLQG